jgi:hypothetical protein
MYLYKKIYIYIYVLYVCRKIMGKLYRWSLWYAIIIFYSLWFKKLLEGPRGMQ